MERPAWWEWELGLTPHVELRMEERGFSEVDLRQMLSDATEVRRGRNPARFELVSRLQGRSWIVVVEPDQEEEVLFVVTAFPRENAS